MAISFNQVPSQIRVPFLYAEFDNANAIQGPTRQPYRTLMIGQKLSAGTQAALTPVIVSSKAQAKTLFGQGSMLHDMVQHYFNNGGVIPLTCVALDDVGAGVQATGEIAFTGTATAAGTVTAYIGGKKVQAAVASGDDASDVAAALTAAIEADDDFIVSAAATLGDVALTAKHKGAIFNELDVRVNYAVEDELPAGITAVVTAMSGGTSNPDVATVFAALDETQYVVVINPYTDSSNYTAAETELADRFGPLRQNDGYAISAHRAASLSAQSTFGNARNSQFTVIQDVLGPNSPWHWASALAGVIAQYGSIDPARPFQTLPLIGLLPPTSSERRTLEERNTLLYSGITSFDVDAGDVVRVDRVITTYKENALGAEDTSYLDLNTLLTLSYLRYDYRNRILLKFPRHKLANDGTRFGPGQAIVTPKVMKAETINIFKEWELLGLVEGVDQFKEDLIVERNASDVNRLDVLLPPDLVNQLIVTGVKIGFLL